MPTVTYPGLSPDVSDAFDLLGNSGRPDLNIFHPRRVKFYHRIAYATAAGSVTNPTAPIEFFKAPNQKYITNWYGASGFPADNAAWLRGIRIKVETGTVSGTGAVQANGAQVTASASAASTTAANLAEFLRELHQGGLITLTIGDRVVANAYGIESFPAGSGTDGAVGGANFATAASLIFGVVNNGSPMQDNFYPIAPWFPILPQKPVSLVYENQSYIAAPGTTDIILRAELDCLVLSPSNN